MEKKSDTDTNFGWWTDKPEREGRPSSWATSWDPPVKRRKPRSVWREAALVVGIAIALIWALIVATGA